MFVSPNHHGRWSFSSFQRSFFSLKGSQNAFGSPTWMEIGIPSSPQDLQHHSCLHYPRAQDTPAWTFERGTERMTVPVSGVMSANNSEALRDAALAGMGLALLPDFSLPTSLRSSKLVELLPDWRPVGVYADQLYAIRPYTAHVPRAVTVFVAYLRKVMAKGFGQPPEHG